MNEASFERDPVEALAEEFLQRRWGGEPVSIEEYAQRHPEWADRIREVFSTVLWLEELREDGAKWEKPSPPREQESTDTGGTEFDRVGDFRIIREIGRGGMGVVYEAEQESLGRRVAIKVLPGVYLSSPKTLRRFRREAQAAARLHHTNIIPVFGVGQQDGVHYYVMQYIRGLALDEVLDGLSQHLLAQDLSGSTLSAKIHSGEASSGAWKKPVSDREPAQEIVVGKSKTIREEVWELAQILLKGGFAGSSGLSFGTKKAPESDSATQPIGPSSTGPLRTEPGWKKAEEHGPKPIGRSSAPESSEKEEKRLRAEGGSRPGTLRVPAREGEEGPHPGPLPEGEGEKETLPEGEESPHPGPLLEGKGEEGPLPEGEKGPHPGPLPKGEGEKGPHPEGKESPHPGPLPEGEGEESPLPKGEESPHPGPLPEGEGEEGPHPGPLPEGEESPHPGPLPKGEGEKSPLPKGEGEKGTLAKREGEKAEGGPAKADGMDSVSEKVPLKMGPGYWRSVAGIGLQVANALHYAHQEGVLHRDIKPGNLILDTEGRVWVADFGLAKLLDQEDMTRSGDVVGTLRYMAPEQLEGRADPRTDVYGLGLTLYELLTLRPAFDETDRGRLIRQVMEEDPPPPRKVYPSVPRDLETIVLKAIARHPEHRYQTAAALAEDLKRFLEDRPVRARRVSVGERLWRWCRRNKTVAVLSITVLGLLVAVAVVASIGYARTSAALRQESYHRTQAESARKLAESEYSRAEANLRVAMEAFEDIFHRIVVEPVFQPRPPTREEGETEESASAEEPWEMYGWTSVLTEKDAAVLQTMLAFYDRFAEQNAENRTLEKETAQAYRRMGEIYSRLGNYEEAEKALTKARSTYARMEQQKETGDLVDVERAVVENRLGNVYGITGRWWEALQCHQRAREILTRLGPEIAETPACRLELARTYSALGKSVAVRWRGRRDTRKPAPKGTPHEELLDTVTCYQEALQLLQHLVEEWPHHPEYRLTLARTYRELAMFAGRRVPPHEIITARQKALQLLEKLVADFPTNPDYRLELAETYAAIARGMGRMSPSEEDRHRLQEAIRIETELVKQYPHVPDYQAALARVHSDQARVFSKLGQFAEAEKHLRQAVALQQGLADRFPESPPYQFELARQLFLLSATLQVQDKKEENRQLLAETIHRAEKLLDRPDRAVLARFFLSWAYNAHADVLQQLGHQEQAAESRRKAEEYHKEQAGPAMPWFPGGPWGFPHPRPKTPPQEPKNKPAPPPVPKRVEAPSFQSGLSCGLRARRPGVHQFG